MTPYHAQHADLFRTVAEILSRDYNAPGVTAETVAEWCENHESILVYRKCKTEVWLDTDLLPSNELAALIADVEGYERREG